MSLLYINYIWSTSPISTCLEYDLVTYGCQGNKTEEGEFFEKSLESRY